MKRKRILMGAALVTMLSFHATAGTHYVDVNSGNPVSPYSTWATAATNIQDALDAARSGDVVLVSNGVYQVGGQVVSDGSINRVVVNKALKLQSVNGPDSTMIVGAPDPGGGNGDNAIRCIYATSGTVTGFTLTNGATKQLQLGGDTQNPALCGGGAYLEYQATLSNCVLVGNLADQAGGGTYGGTLISCTLSNNSTAGGGLVAGGGGAAFSNLRACTLMQNTAWTGGGILGSSANGCLFINNSANAGGAAAGPGSALTNCTIVSNYAATAGGGVFGNTSFGGGSYQWYALTCDHCTLSGNATDASNGVGGGGYFGFFNACMFYTNSGAHGGAACASILSNCLLAGNSATDGGGVSDDPFWADSGCTITNCTISSNSAAGQGGGAINSTLYNSIIFQNSAPGDPNCSNCTNFYCCTPVVSTYGSGNITADPLFVNWPAGDFHLQSGSPCINAGANTNAPSGTDLDGKPRILGGIVDIGAYEYGQVLTAFQLWLQSYGLATDGSADYADPDGDGMNNWQEWRCGTDPTNAQSVLRIISASRDGPGRVVSWQSVTNRYYFLERATNLVESIAFQSVVTNVPGQDGTITWTDYTVTGTAALFYRVGVQ